MLINELPNECLLIIFGSINELEDLLNCYKVCSRWSHLIAERTKKVEYLTRKTDSWTHSDYDYDFDFDHVYYRTKESIDGSCLNTLFPNLIITEFSYTFPGKIKNEDIVTLFKEIKSLKGLIYCFYNSVEIIFRGSNELVMMSSCYVDPFMIKNGVSIKQLYFWDLTLDDFKENAHYFPNLERLHIDNGFGYPDEYYDGPICSKLKILELFLSYDEANIYYGFQFMDSCPNLQSAHIQLESNHLFVDESLKHKSLQDLVIKFIYTEFSLLQDIDWNELKRLFMKYPNLKHLSLRSYKELEDEHVQQLVRILPNLVLFEVRGCPRVTQMAADFVQDYCKLYGRSIKFYFDQNLHEIRSDWPQLSTTYQKLSQGFDFMKNCFLKEDFHVSPFLIPSED